MPGGRNYMRRKLTTISIVAILVILSTTTTSNAMSVKQKPIKELISETVNHQVYLGSASIIGNGSSSTLEAVAENDLLIGLDSESSHVDFYITYDMNCSGTTDGGIITLMVSINGQNITPNIVQTSTSKNGTLKIENIEVNRQDALIFVINVAYGSVIPLYSNSTSATGAGVFSKAKTIVEKSTNPFLDLLEKYPRMFLMLRYLLRL
jgi:hypothetical protein